MGIGNKKEAALKTQGLFGFFTDSFVYAVGTAINQALRFLLLPIVLRSLAPADLGVYDSARMLLLVAAPLVALGMESAVAILINETQDRDKIGHWMNMGLTVVSISAILAGLFGLLFNRLIYQIFLGGEGDIRVLWVVIGLMVVAPVGEFCRNILKWQFRRSAYAFLLISEAVITFIVGVVLVRVVPWGVFGWAVAILVSSIYNLVASIVANHHIWHRPQLKGIGFRLVKLGFPFALVTTSLQLTPFITRLVLVQLVGLSLVGIYGVGERVALILGLLLSGFTLAWGPFYLSKQHDKNAPALFGRAVTYYLVVATWLGVAVIAFSSVLIKGLTGAGYDESSGVVAPLVILTTLTGMEFVAVGGMYIKKKGHYMIGVYLVTAIIALVLNLLLIPRAGVIGAAWAATIAKGIGIILSVSISQRLFPIQWNLSRLIRIGVINLAAITMAIFVNGLEMNFASLTVRMSFLALFPLLFVIAGVVKLKELMQLWLKLKSLSVSKSHAS